MNVGGGVLAAEAWDEAMELAELMAMPVASTLVGKGAFPGEPPAVCGGAACTRRAGTHPARPTS